MNGSAIAMLIFASLVLYGGLIFVISKAAKRNRNE